MNQCERILNLLRMGPVCARSYAVEFPRLAPRIYELRKAGHVIGTRPCLRATHFHRSTRQVEYVLDPPETLF